MSEQTLVLIKPDAVKRQLIGKILQRYEEKGLKISAMKMIKASMDQAEKHYAEHKEKPFFNELTEFITSSPLIAFVLEGENAVKITRAINGATNPSVADPGTIRGDYAINTRYNLVHASDSLESAKREISVFFQENELLSYELSSSQWL